MDTFTDQITGYGNRTGAAKSPVKVAVDAPITLHGLQTIDSIALAPFDRVLVMGQTDPVENGIYEVSDATWRRAVDFQSNRDVREGMLIFVTYGSLADNIYTVSSPDDVIIGETPITFDVMPDAVMGGAPPVLVDTELDLEALAEPYEAVNLAGYDAPADGGGGLLYLRDTSVEAIDKGLVFPAPAGIGRYIRPADGTLHSRWFGLIHSTTKDQSARLQDFFHALCQPGGSFTKHYRGMIDPGVIDCAGATVYLERDGIGDGTGFFQNSAQLVGANRRNSILRNLVLSAGSAPWKTLTASGNVVMRDFRIEGWLHTWNMEGNAYLHNLSVTRGSLDTQASPLVPDYPDFRGPPNVSDPPDEAGTATWRSWASLWMFITYASNHPLISNISINGKAGTGIPSPTGDYRKGALLQGIANCHMLHGTMFGTNPSIQIDGAGAVRNWINGTKFEECEGCHVWVRAGEDHIISTFNRQGIGHNTTEPCIRIGEQGQSTPTKIVLRECCLFSDQPGLGRAVYVEQNDLGPVTIESCSFEKFATAIDIRPSVSTIAGARPVQDVWIDDSNRFETNTVDVNRGARTQPLRPGAGQMRPWSIVQGTTTTWSGYNGVHQRLTTNASRTITVGEMAAGVIYRLFITKGNAAHAITWAGDPLVWPGAVPDFAAMTTTQYAVVAIEAINMGSGVVLLANSLIRGT